MVLAQIEVDFLTLNGLQIDKNPGLTDQDLFFSTGGPGHRAWADQSRFFLRASKHEANGEAKLPRELERSRVTPGGEG